MAIRPYFVVNDNGYNQLIKKKYADFKWYPGFSIVQKQKSIISFHNQIPPKYKTLEISSKSNSNLGKKLSAFNLMINTVNNKKVSVEVAFQASKVFEYGGPYVDMYGHTPKQVKKDIRLRNSGKLRYFNSFNKQFPSEPKTLFYNWLYINALNQYTDLKNEIIEYNAFTDIEFNPNKSINCQAEAAAIFVSLYKNKLLDYAISSSSNFEKVVYQQNIQNSLHTTEKALQTEQLRFF